MALYFEYQINKKRTPADCFFGNFAHWDIRDLRIISPIQCRRCSVSLAKRIVKIFTWQTWVSTSKS